jgi:hypothetical protein
MALYAGGIQTYTSANFTGGFSSVVADLKSNQPGGSSLLEMSVVSSINTQNCIFGIGRSSSELFQLSPSYLTPYDLNDRPSFSALAQQWSLDPAAPTLIFRRHSVTSQLGVIWSFPRGIRIGRNASIILCGLAALAWGFNITVEVDE